MQNELSTRDGWRVDRTSPSLPESHRTIAIAPGAGFWRKLLAFSGPGYLVAVGYMDPGNWATDLAGGSASIEPAKYQDSPQIINVTN